MSDDISVAAGDWRTTYTVLMCVALTAIVVGSLPVLLPQGGTNEFGLRGFSRLMIWLYGLIGLALCFLEQAPFRYGLALTGFTWSIALLGASSIPGLRTWMHPEPDYPFDHDGNMSLLTGSIAVTILLMVYDVMKNWMPTGFTVTITWLVRCLIIIWAFISFLTLALLQSR